MDGGGDGKILPFFFGWSFVLLLLANLLLLLCLLG
jgi:hypothetical protein